MKAEPRIIGQLSDGTDIVEIYCPVCNSDRVEELETAEFECVRCGQVFENDYGNNEVEC